MSKDMPKWHKDNKNKAKDDFQNQANDNKPAEPGKGSDMVKKQKPHPELTPQGSLRRGPDKAKHLRELRDERRQAKPIEDPVKQPARDEKDNPKLSKNFEERSKKEKDEVEQYLDDLEKRQDKDKAKGKDRDYDR